MSVELYHYIVVSLNLSCVTGAADSPTDSNNKRKKFTVGDVFNQDDEEAGDAAKKRKLIPLDYEDTSEKKPSTAEEKRQHIKKLIERIPTAKDELFSYQLDWTMVDRVRIT